MPDEFHKLAQVFELNVFEPVNIEGEKDIHAPYLMNDAVESYFAFEKSVITGEYKELEGEQLASIERLDGGYMLIVNQGGENAFTIRFTRLRLKTFYFNYGCMGHFWVKGYEYLRQLEYQFADIRDKYRYLGDGACTKQELIFAKLADFPPVKKYRSVPEPYYVPYPDCVYSEAVAYLIDIADSTGDSVMSGMLKTYQKKPTSLKSNMISAMFHMKSHGRFINRIISDMRNAASCYGSRVFGREEEAVRNRVHRMAESAMNAFVNEGFECLLYREEPFMYSKDSMTYKEHVLVFKNGIINRKCDIYTYE
ncbi:MAG TPA: hypothetical protein DDX70_10765 [Bacteroides sp.]|nr:hypothetical protein [Bacteroides sp.]